MSKKGTLNAAEDAVAVTTAGNFDFATTALSGDVALFGTQKYLQLGLAAGIGAVISNKRHSGDMFNFG